MLQIKFGQDLSSNFEEYICEIPIDPNAKIDKGRQLLTEQSDLPIIELSRDFMSVLVFCTIKANLKTRADNS